MSNVKILKGNFVWTNSSDKFEIIENGFIVVDVKKIVDIFKNLPNEYKNEEIIDYGNKLIIPGFIDLHVHAPQFENRGVGYDRPLLSWLDTYTFPEESKYKNIEYAKNVYKNFVNALKANGTTRCVTFGTIHKESTKVLVDTFESVGLGAFVGKVNMDRNSSENLCENTLDSIKETEDFIKNTNENNLVKPIITPRFVPTCTSELMKNLGEMAKKYNIPVQSHLSENIDEIKWVKELHPDCENYGEVYNMYGLFGQTPTIMAHCVYSPDSEINTIKKNGVYIAHCPESNIDLSSGIAPVMKYIKKGLKVGLGTDVAGGHSISMNRAIVSAIQSSKLYSIYVDSKYGNMTVSEGFYLATKSGGSFFGKVGSFEPGYEFDALVIDDSDISNINERTLEERIEKFIFVGDDRNIEQVYIAGKKL